MPPLPHSPSPHKESGLSLKTSIKFFLKIWKSDLPKLCASDLILIRPCCVVKSQDCSRVDRVRFETLINSLVVFVLTHSAQVVAFISYLDCSRVDSVQSPVRIESLVEPGLIQCMWQSFKSVRHLLHSHCTFQFISFHFNKPGQAVQYKYRLYEAKRDCTPNEWCPSSKINGLYRTVRTVPKMELYSMVQEDTVLSHPTKKRKIPYRAICAPPPLFPLIFHLYLYPFRVCA